MTFRSFVLPYFVLLFPLLAAATGISPGQHESNSPLVTESPDFTLLTTDTTSQSSHSSLHRRSFGTWAAGGSTLTRAGVTGVAAMQVAVVSDDQVLIFDRAENNPLKINGQPVWGSIYTVSTQAVRPLDLKTNSFCAGGGFVSDGRMISIGGNGVQWPYTSGASGYQAIRIFTPCAGSEKCDVYENPEQLHLTSHRWYPSTCRLEDGSLMILGGDRLGGFNNAWYQDNPTFEFWPPKLDGQAIYSKFLHDALNTNLFPVTFALPSGEIFVAANEMAMLYNWKTNTETRIPGSPNGVKINYPSSAAAVLLPLTIANKYTPEILMCGGSTAAVDGMAISLSSKYPASSQCIRMVITAAGIARGWVVEQMPEARVMADGILTPDGKVVIVNGAGTGVAGYGNVRNQVGQSNADHPVYHADVYDPLGAPGQRFLSNFPSSAIERLYHSSATLLPDGTIFIAGSNPNKDVSSKTYATRYQVEILSPPYIFSPARPVLHSVPTHLLYGKQSVIKVTIPRNAKSVTAVLMDMGFSTHGVHSSARNVELAVSKYKKGASTIKITGPSIPRLYSPGYGWLYIIADGVPSKGKRIMVGAGKAPPNSPSATSVSQSGIPVPQAHKKGQKLRATQH